MELEEAKKQLKDIYERDNEFIKRHGYSSSETVRKDWEALQVIISELDKLTEQRQKLIEKLDEDIEDNKKTSDDYYLGIKFEAQEIKDFIGG